MKIIWLGHASYKIEEEGISVILDPYRNLSVPGLKFPKGIEANYVFCSHDHYDHDAKNLVKIIPTDKKLDYKLIEVPHDDVGGKKRGMCYVTIINLDGRSLAHLGDLGDIRVIDKIKELQYIDVILWPINGFYTIGAKEAKDVLEILKPKVLIPMHYEMKELRVGYPDGNQIEIFKNLVKDYRLVDDYQIEVNDTMLDKNVLIFEKFYK